MVYCTQAECLYLPIWEKLPFTLGRVPCSTWESTFFSILWASSELLTVSREVAFFCGILESARTLFWSISKYRKHVWYFTSSSVDPSQRSVRFLLLPWLLWIEVWFHCLNKSSREISKKDIRERKAQHRKLTRANCIDGLSDLCKEELVSRGLTVRCPVLYNVDLT